MGLGFHPATVAVAKAVVKRDGTFEIRVRYDVLAFALDATPLEVSDDAMAALVDGPDEAIQERLAEARARFAADFRIEAGASTESSISEFPTAAGVRRWIHDNPKMPLPVMQETVVRGQLPKGSRTFSVRFPEVLGTVILSVEFPYTEQYAEPVAPGSSSTALKVPTEAELAAAEAEVKKRLEQPVAPPPNATSQKVDSAPVKQPTKAPAEPSEESRSEEKAVANEEPKALVGEKLGPPKPKAAFLAEPEGSKPEEPVLSAEPAQEGAWYHVWIKYVQMGFVHILPFGLDHILFVLGLFLLSRKAKDVLVQITAFTLAHTITLALTVLGHIRLPGSIVEPIIALSIGFIAVENLFTTEMKSWRPFVVFAFGLMHGMGFAGVLQDVGLPEGQLVPALISFNVGVELGQLAVVGAAALAFGWVRSQERYRKYVVVPASLGIAAMALYWTVERIF